MSTEIIISNDGGVYFITVNGRATFEHASQLRNLAKSLESVVFSRICLDLANCGGMDSTFMGILAMLGLRAKKINAPMCVYKPILRCCRGLDSRSCSSSVMAIWAALPARDGVPEKKPPAVRKPFWKRIRL